MTIRQIGGVFGRNPTFNNVDIEGTLTVNGEPISDFGTMASQDADAVAITGGAIDGTVIGGTTPATADFTTIDSTGLATLAALTVNTSTLFVDAVNNRVGLGTTNPSQMLDVNGNTRLVGSDPYVQALRTSDFYYGKLSADGFAAFTNTNDSAPVILKTATTARLTVEAGGDVLLNTGNLVIGTSGKGIDFSATAGTGTSELFDDYEEGTFTPVIADAATGGNTGTASQAYGYYTKVGRNVTIHLNMTDIDTTGLTAGNDVYIQGLPFTSLAVTGLITYNGSIWGALIDLNAATPYLVPAVADGQSAILLKEWGDNTGTDNLIVSELTSGSSDLNISLSYFAA